MHFVATYCGIEGSIILDEVTGHFKQGTISTLEANDNNDSQVRKQKPNLHCITVCAGNNILFISLNECFRFKITLVSKNWPMTM